MSSQAIRLLSHHSLPGLERAFSDCMHVPEWHVPNYFDCGDIHN